VSRLLYALVPLAGLAVTVAVQVSLIRGRGGAGLLRSLFEGWAAGLLAVLGAEIWAAPPLPDTDRLPLAAVNVATHGLLWYCYFHFVNLGVTARRPRLLIELAEAPGGLTYEQLLERYNGRHQVEARLERLLGGGQLVLRDGRYRVGQPVMLLIAKVIVALKRLLLGKTSEFARH
jgi:hypothetical protein